MALAHARRTEQQHVGAAVEPLVAFGQRHHLRLGHAGHGGEVEAGQPLVRAQRRLDAVPVDAARLALGHFVFEQGLEQPLPRPALAIRLRAQITCQALDRGQPQLAEHHPQATARSCCGATHSVHLDQFVVASQRWQLHHHVGHLGLRRCQQLGQRVQVGQLVELDQLFEFVGQLRLMPVGGQAPASRPSSCRPHARAFAALTAAPRSGGTRHAGTPRRAAPSVRTHRACV